MKKITFILILLVNISFFPSVSKAQYVTIPDSNFASWLDTHGFSACMVGNTLDTTCPAVINATSINVYNKGIVDLTGIQYFDNLNYLKCDFNTIVTLPDLPLTIDTFICSSNMLTALPNLPPSLTVLDCHSNALTVLPSLPSSLLNMDCSYNDLAALPVSLPLLSDLNCNSNLLTALPALPATLISLYCGNNHLGSLPPLPVGLLELYCYNTQLSILPALPSTLEQIDCSSNPLYNLPAALPASLIYLGCSSDSLTSLPPFPLNLSAFDCSNNQLTYLPAIPPTVWYFYCRSNQLTSIPQLGYISWMDCSNNQLFNFPSITGVGMFATWYDFSNNNITYIPDLTGVTTLYFSNNQITSIDPNGHFYELYCSNNNITSFSQANLAQISNLDCSHNLLSTLPPVNSPYYNAIINCSFNQITSLPLMGGCTSLDCSNNQLNFITSLPHKMTSLNVSNNPALSCLPKMDTVNVLNWGNTAISCLPNAMRITSAIPSVSSLKLCQPASGCAYAWNMFGSVFNDLDSDSIIDPGEQVIKNIPVKLDSAGITKQIFYTNSQGYYSFETGVGSYTIRVDTAALPYNVVWPLTGAYNSVLTPVDSLDFDMNFGLLCKPGYLDLKASGIAASAPLRPAAVRTLFLHAGDAAKFYAISCANGISGTVQAIIDGPVTFVAPAQGAIPPSTVNGDTITWNINDFSFPDPDSSFNIVVALDSIIINSNDTVCVNLQVSIAPGEGDTANNSLQLCFPVVNSYDPNVKEAYPAGIAQGNNEITYTIYFQNTGTAPAENIYILDTLDINLDETTFAFLSSSHAAVTQLLPGRIARFSFPSVNLPDSTSNEPASHGYVQFKISRKASSDPNLVIANSASIYFDLNPPVITNETGTVYNFDCSLLNDIQLSDTVICYNGTITATNGSSFPLPVQYSWKLDSLVTGIGPVLTLSNIAPGHHMVWLTISYESCTITTGRIILVYAAPAVPAVIVNEDTLSVLPFSNYQWYWNGNALPSANQGTLIVSQSGYYTVKVTNVYGCTTFSDTVYICTGLDTMHVSNSAACSYYTISASCPATSALPIFYQWSIDSIMVDTTANILIAGLTPGQHLLSLTVSSGNSIATVSHGIYIFPVTPKPVITINGDTLTSGMAAAYQWYRDNMLIAGANQQSLKATSDGWYTVHIIDSNGCMAVSDSLLMLGMGIGENKASGFNVYPNPATGSIFILSGPEFRNVEFEIYNELGMICCHGKLNNTKQQISLENFAGGLYLVSIKTGKGCMQKRFIKK